LSYLREGCLSRAWLTTYQDGSASDFTFSDHAEDYTSSSSCVNLEKQKLVCYHSLETQASLIKEFGIGLK